MTYWQLFLILQLGMFAVYLWAQEASIYFYRKWRPGYSLIPRNVSDALEWLSIKCGMLAALTLPLTPILFLLSNKIDPIRWLW